MAKFKPTTSELDYKERHYQYGVCKERDFPTRGKISTIFFIKVRTGVGLFVKYRLIYRTTEIDKWAWLTDKQMKEKIEEEIENYTLKSRKMKLKKLNLNN